MSVQRFAPAGVLQQYYFVDDYYTVYWQSEKSGLNIVTVCCLDQNAVITSNSDVFCTKILFYIHIRKCKQTSWWRHCIACMDVSDQSIKFGVLRREQKVDPWIAAELSMQWAPSQITFCIDENSNTFFGCAMCILPPIATDDPVAWCVCQSAMQLRCATRLNRSRSCSGCRLLWT